MTKCRHVVVVTCVMKLPLSKPSTFVAQSLQCSVQLPKRKGILMIVYSTVCIGVTTVKAFHIGSPDSSIVTKEEAYSRLPNRKAIPMVAYRHERVF